MTAIPKRVKSGDKAVARRSGRTAPAAFRAVSVIRGQGACECVRALASQRFLCKEAPPLPMADCTATTCACRYLHHADRRNAGNDSIGMPAGYTGRAGAAVPPDRRRS